jgi:hypothetical protein
MVIDHDGSLQGPSCPTESTPCYKAYWMVVTLSGVFAFIDAGESSCAAFFALARSGSTEAQGTLNIISVSMDRKFSWLPAGYSGSYSASSSTVTLSAPGCTASYIVDSPMNVPIAMPTAAGPASPGSATLSFIGAVHAGGADAGQCPSVCFHAGYSLAWDAAGPPRPAPHCTAPHRTAPHRPTPPHPAPPAGCSALFCLQLAIGSAKVARNRARAAQRSFHARRWTLAESRLRRARHGVRMAKDAAQKAAQKA